MLSLAAGTVLDAGPVELVEAAAAAGFDACGLRLDPASTPLPTVAAITRALASTGLRLLDLEVVRMRPGEPVATHRPLVDLAAELGAAWMLAVSEIVDEVERAERLAELTEFATDAGVGVSLEFMGFTAVRTLADALATTDAVAAQAAANAVAEVDAAVPARVPHVLVDALHLARTGGTPAEVAAHAARLSYVQLCDAPRKAPAGGPDALADEARHRRLLPGAGQLDLAGLVAAVPVDLPFSVEVQSDRLAAEYTVRPRAELAFRAATAVLSARGSPRHCALPARGT